MAGPEQGRVQVRHMRWIAIWTLAALLSGCAWFLPKFEKPRLSVVSVDVLKAELWEQQLKVRMRVQNPHDRSLPVKGLSYSLEIEGQEFANGVSGASFVVPALGEAEFDMNVTANMAGTLIKLFAHGRNTQQIDYHLKGKVSLSHGWLRSIPFEETGTFNLQ
jgi:LEA14-like dessication related protein